MHRSVFCDDNFYISTYSRLKHHSHNHILVGHAIPPGFDIICQFSLQPQIWSFSLRCTNRWQSLTTYHWFVPLIFLYFIAFIVMLNFPDTVCLLWNRVDSHAVVLVHLFSQLCVWYQCIMLWVVVLQWASSSPSTERGERGGRGRVGLYPDPFAELTPNNQPVEIILWDSQTTAHHR